MFFIIFKAVSKPLVGEVKKSVTTFGNPDIPKKPTPTPTAKSSSRFHLSILCISTTIFTSVKNTAASNFPISTGYLQGTLHLPQQLGSLRGRPLGWEVCPLKSVTSFNSEEGQVLIEPLKAQVNLLWVSPMSNILFPMVTSQMLPGNPLWVHFT
ncbi:Hypothetical predicted protein [Podarcis lilfordi]|uniref:Uncharacterized protein n=1 Tax=Podarcis lilfordi TaxID=74358 RepID=A0AA35JSY3_9SAUR|nr:Hypothetical predicted protein [Podarcis lilfordi]